MEVREIFSAYNMAMVVASIIILQSVRKALARKCIVLSKNTLKTIASFLGLPIALLSMGIDGKLLPFNVFLFIGLSVIYSALCILFYQTGKLSMEGVKEYFKESMTDESS